MMKQNIVVNKVKVYSSWAIGKRKFLLWTEPEIFEMAERKNFAET